MASLHVLVSFRCKADFAVEAKPCNLNRFPGSLVEVVSLPGQALPPSVLKFYVLEPWHGSRMENYRPANIDSMGKVLTTHVINVAR